MKKITILLIVAVSLLTTSCAVKRYVTADHITDDDKKYYIAYAEVTDKIFMKESKSMVKACIINDDNTLECKEQDELSIILNPHLGIMK